MCTSDQEQCCLCLFSLWTWLHFHTRVAWIHSSFCILTWHTRTVQKQWEISHNHCMAHFQYNADWVHRENAHTAVQVPIFGCLDQQLHFCDCLWLNADVWAGKWCWNVCRGRLWFVKGIMTIFNMDPINSYKSDCRWPLNEKKQKNIQDVCMIWDKGV